MHSETVEAPQVPGKKKKLLDQPGFADSFLTENVKPEGVPFSVRLEKIFQTKNSRP